MRLLKSIVDMIRCAHYAEDMVGHFCGTALYAFFVVQFRRFHRVSVKSGCDTLLLMENIQTTETVDI